MADDDLSCLLVTILDINPCWWSKHDSSCKDEESFVHCLESLIVFLNSHLLMKHTNKLGFIVCHNESSSFVYPDESAAIKEYKAAGDGKYEEFARLDNSAVDDVKRIYENLSNDKLFNAPSSTKLAAAMSQALCYIHRIKKESSAAENLSSRILVLKGTADTASEYMPIMSCIFAAQKNDIVVDGCSLDGDSGYLQQAADITAGNYSKIPALSGLLQYLLWIFLPNSETRKCLVLPSSAYIDYRGACFCHRQLVDVGFVCSVCLSIYCKCIPRCMTCQTVFKLPALSIASKPKKRKKP